MPSPSVPPRLSPIHLPADSRHRTVQPMCCCRALRRLPLPRSACLRFCRAAQCRAEDAMSRACKRNPRGLVLRTNGTGARRRERVATASPWRACTPSIRSDRSKWDSRQAAVGWSCLSLARWTVRSSRGPAAVASECSSSALIGPSPRQPALPRLHLVPAAARGSPPDALSLAACGRYKLRAVRMQIEVPSRTLVCAAHSEALRAHVDAMQLALLSSTVVSSTTALLVVNASALVSPLLLPHEIVSHYNPLTQSVWVTSGRLPTVER